VIAQPARATLIVPANAAAARLVRLVASAIAIDIGLDGDALDDVRLVAGELADSLVRTADGDLMLEFRVDGHEMTVSGDTRPPSDRPMLVDADVLHHADVTGVRAHRWPGHFDLVASGPVESPSDAGQPARR